MPKRLADDVARRVRALIEEQQLEAGMRLPAERQLAAQLGVSRNSLREALAMLVNEGVLLSRRGGGTFVRWQHEAWSEQNIVQPLKTLLADDPITALISSKPATPSKPAPPGMRRCGPPTPKKRKFACALKPPRAKTRISPRRRTSASIWRSPKPRNVVLLQTMRGFFDLLQSSVKQSRQRMYLVPPVFARLTEQHQAVMEAIVAGDAEAARQAMMAI
jgi:GntR family L-lactate dehydrogenase operon transcriptional regulator